MILDRDSIEELPGDYNYIDHILNMGKYGEFERIFIILKDIWNVNTGGVREGVG